MSMLALCLASAICLGSEPSLSADGRRLVCEREVQGRVRIVVRDLADGSERFVSPETGSACQPVWTADGEVAFVWGDERLSAFEAQERRAESGFNVYRTDRGALKRLTDGRRHDAMPSFGPDGTLYLVSEMAVERIAADGTRQVLLPSDGLNRAAADPQVSPDGRTLLRAEIAGFDGNWRLVLSDLAQPTNRIFLTPETMSAHSPVFSPDGKTIAFTGFSGNDDGWSVYLMRLEDRKLRRFVRGRDPSFAPDGKSLLYSERGVVCRKPFAAAGRRPVPVFEKIALIDHFDYLAEYDIETPENRRKIVRRVAETGATTYLWRTHSGRVPRYASAAEPTVRFPYPLEKRRTLNASSHAELINWNREDLGEDDSATDAFQAIAELSGNALNGFHLTSEDAHWSYEFLRPWALDHPEFWCRTRTGEPQMKHLSFAFPEVREYRLKIVRELLARHPDVFYWDGFRHGGYEPSIEYVKPNLEEWGHRHPGVPPPENPSDPAWLEVVRIGHDELLRQIRVEIDRISPETRFLVAIDRLRRGGSTAYTDNTRGFDWRKLVAARTVDGIVVTSVQADERDPFGQVESYFKAFVDEVAGRTKVYFPILAYNFSKTRPGYVALARWAHVPRTEAVSRLLAIADRCRADGIVLECVDPDNYPEEDCRLIREFTSEREKGK